MKIQNVTDRSFRRYGRVLESFDVSELLREMKHTPLPDDVIYVPSVAELESIPIFEAFKNRVYGGLPIQIGFCNGHNQTLNALEYHRDSELNVAVTDLILLIGSREDVKDDFTYDTSLVEAFLIPAGTAIEVYATTLHYAPCGVKGDGFRCVVILPRDTNKEITFTIGKDGEDRLMTAKNKWLIAHQEANIDGAFNGLIGENITL
ncbi:MAG: DUF4867 family protein [Lachnospiraceae bacterium]